MRPLSNTKPTNAASSALSALPTIDFINPVMASALLVLVALGESINACMVSSFANCAPASKTAFQSECDLFCSAISKIALA